MKNARTPAFPVTENADGSSPTYSGITKMEYFTAMAMMGILAAGKLTNSETIADVAIRNATEALKRFE